MSMHFLCLEACLNGHKEDGSHSEAPAGTLGGAASAP